MPNDGTHARRSQGLDRGARWAWLHLAWEDRAASRMHQGDLGAQEPDVLDSPREARSLQPALEEPLVRCGDLFSSPSVRPVEGHVVGILGEPRAVGTTVAPTPIVEELLEEVVDGRLVGLVRCMCLLHDMFF